MIDLLLSSGSSTDDSNIVISHRKNYNDDLTILSFSNGPFSFFAIRMLCVNGKEQLWVSKNRNCHFKTNLMFPLVGLGFLGIPLKRHCDSALHSNCL